VYVVTTTPYVIEYAAVAEDGAVRADAGTVYVQCRACGRYGIKPQPHACAAILGLKLGNWFVSFDTVVAIRARQLKNAYRLMNYLSTPADAPRDAEEALEVPPALGDLTPDDAPAPSDDPFDVPDTSLLTVVVMGAVEAAP
jgi:hypothetical protein